MKRLFLIIFIFMIFIFFPIIAVGEEIKVKEHHFLIVPLDEDRIIVEETILLTQDIIPKKIVLSLPEGYKELKFVKGLTKENTEIKNGRIQYNEKSSFSLKEIAFNYRIASKAGRFNISKSINNPVKEVYIWTPMHGIKIRSQDFIYSGITNINGNHFNVYINKNTNPVEKIEFSIELEEENIIYNAGDVDKKSPQFHTPSHIRFWEQSPFSGIDAHLFLILVIVIPTVVIIYAIIKTRKAREREGSFEHLLAEQKELLVKLAELERKKRENEISSKEYMSNREVYKNKLIKLKLQTKNFIE